MPSDILLDSLCNQRLAIKKTVYWPSDHPVYPNKAGVRDATFYFPRSIYSLDINVMRSHNNTVIVEPQEDKSWKVVTEFFLKILKAIFGDEYTQPGGWSFTTSGRNPYYQPSPYRARHTEIINVDGLFEAMGMFGGGPGKPLDFANGINLIKNALIETESFKSKHKEKSILFRPEYLPDYESGKRKNIENKMSSENKDLGVNRTGKDDISTEELLKARWDSTKMRIIFYEIDSVSENIFYDKKKYPVVIHQDYNRDTVYVLWIDEKRDTLVEKRITDGRILDSEYHPLKK